MYELNWVEENGKHLGFEDGALAYRVFEDEDGWTYEDVLELVGVTGYDTAQEAIQAAEADYANKQGVTYDDDETLLDVLDDEGSWDDYWDAVAHERMERAKGFID